MFCTKIIAVLTLTNQRALVFYFSFKAYSHRARDDGRIEETIDEFVHKSNQCTVPYGGIHTCFSIHPTIRPGTRKMVLWMNSHQIRLVIWDESNLCLGWMGLEFSLHTVTPVV